MFIAASLYFKLIIVNEYSLKTAIRLRNNHHNLVKVCWFIFVKVIQQWSKLVEKSNRTATVSENSLKDKNLRYEYFSFQNMCISVSNKLNCLNRWFVFIRHTSNSSDTLNFLVIYLRVVLMKMHFETRWFFLAASLYFNLIMYTERT